MSREKLVSAAMSLRTFSPDLWEQFVVAVREHSAQTTAEMTRCPPELLLRAQGMAIAMQDLAATLRDAPSLHETMRGKQHGQERNHRG